MNSIDQNTFDKIRSFITKECGIVISEEKKYLVETRLMRLLAESGSATFEEFYKKVILAGDDSIKEKVIDAMTTNETLWFRDGAPWKAFMECHMPRFEEQLKRTPDKIIRIWSAASSTGQEAYTIAILIDDYCKKNRDISPDSFEIVGTDISPSALFIAMAGRYDRISMSRGFVGDWKKYKEPYFRDAGRVSSIVPEIKRRVQFKRHNLLEGFSTLGNFDMVFLRNVTIYFSDKFKKDLFDRVANSISDGGYLVLGTAETIIGFSNRYEMFNHGRAIYYQRTE